MQVLAGLTDIFNVEKGHEFTFLKKAKESRNI
jgi:hypothetical protein